jgi:glutamate N-acetyltransferase/amino-acid N-acetyltransferase
MSQLHFLSPSGFRAGGVYAGIKQKKTNDVGVLVCDAPGGASAAAVFTSNKVFAAPVAVGREHVADGSLRAIVINSGNANACTGRQGHRDALSMCTLAAQLLDCDRDDVLPGSTGIIGHLLPMEKVHAGIRAAAADLGSDESHALAFNDAILTTDTKRKFAAARFKLGRQVVTLTGICKGAGMIGPRLAGRDGRTLSIGRAPAKRGAQGTMLAYLLTDADVPARTLQGLLEAATALSFNSVTIDNHTSTNDTAVLLASGQSGARVKDRASVLTFAAALEEICTDLARQIAADGEGATKLVTVRVRHASSDNEAGVIARTIADSPLVKCALHGNDPNWGRIVSAAGYAGVAFDPDRATLKLQGTTVFRGGKPVPFDAAKVSAAMAAAELLIDLDCRLGDADAIVWTCDFSKDYVTINADYHT